MCIKKLKKMLSKLEALDIDATKELLELKSCIKKIEHSLNFTQSDSVR